MKLTQILIVLGSAALAVAKPVMHNPFKRANMTVMPTDTQVLQYALTLENLEATLYAQALIKYSQQDFTAAGYPTWVRNRIEEIATHEMVHVNVLSAALGNDSVAPCNYTFPYTDVKSFVVFACALENVGTSAYLGAAQYISDPGYLTVAGSILTTEARHQSFFYSNVLSGAPWSGPFDTPLTLDMVYTLASQLITSCPDSNAMLPVMAYPPITVMMSPLTGNAPTGTNVTLSFKGSANMTGTMYAAIYNGLATQVLPLENMTFKLPPVQGYSYVVVTTQSDQSMVSADNIVAGPVEIQTSFTSSQPNPGYMNPIVSSSG